MNEQEKEIDVKIFDFLDEYIPMGLSDNSLIRNYMAKYPELGAVDAIEFSEGLIAYPNIKPKQ